MRIIDTFSDMLGCYINNNFELNQWVKYADRISPTLSRKLLNDIQGYDFQKDVLPILNALPCNFDELNTAHRSFLCLTDDLSKRFEKIFGSDIEVDIIFCLGLCNGAGWATTLDDKHAILLGVEKIIELSWYDKTNLAGLIYHELGHIWHSQTRKITYKQFNNDGLWLLYREGIAMYIEQLLAADTSFYHQNKDGWLSWCCSNKEGLLNEFLNCISTNKSTNDFFGDWNCFNGKSDIGYFLGCEFTKALAQKYSMYELANMDEELFYDELCDAVI